MPGLLGILVWIKGGILTPTWSLLLHSSSQLIDETQHSLWILLLPPAVAPLSPTLLWMKQSEHQLQEQLWDPPIGWWQLT